MNRRRFAARLAQLAAASWGARWMPAAIARDAVPSPPPASKALRVAALVERVLKLQAQAAQGVLAKRARRTLAPALRGLEAAVRALRVPAAPPELHERAAILALLVGQWRARAGRDLGRDAAREMDQRAEEIEWEAERIAALLGEGSDARRALAAKAMDGAYRAERIGRMLLWARWEAGGTQGATAKAALQADLEALRAAAGDAPAIRAELQVAENQAAFLFAASWRGERVEAARDLEFALKASDNAAESLERLAALWERTPG